MDGFGDLSGHVRADLESPALGTINQALRGRLRSLQSLLWSAAGTVDTAHALPAGHVEALAGAGLYGIFAPEEIGGLGLSYPELCAVIEELATACVATTFVWVQHLRLLGAMLDTTVPVSLRSRYRAGVISGATKGGVVLTGLMPGPPRLRAARTGKTWTLQGEAPWVSGWGIVDLLVVVARGPGDTAVSVLLDACEQPGLSASPLRLSAMDATRTVQLRFNDLVVGPARVLGQEDLKQGTQNAERLRLNGSFALGVTKRCCLMLGPSPLDAQLMGARERLDRAQGADVPAARAAACELAVRAAHALATTRGSRSALAGDLGERTSREAALLLVFGSRPAIKEALLDLLHFSPPLEGGLG